MLLWHSKILCHYTPITTASYYYYILLIQQAIMLIYHYWFNNQIRLYTPITTASYYVNIPLLIQQTIMLIYSYWYNNLIHYYNLIQIYMPQPSNKLWYDTLNTKNTAWLSMNKAAARPLLEDPRRCAHQERLGGRQANCPRLWISC